MSNAVVTVLADIVSSLEAFNRDRLQPDAALKCLAELGKRYPELRLDLVWNEEGFDGSLHYDVLIKRADGATISLAVCPERALPWPLRGVQRWRDSHLARVNNTVLEVADAIAQLEVLWSNTPMMQWLVDGCLVTEALKQHPVEVDPEELREAMTVIRRKRGLMTVADTAAWMEATGTSRTALDGMALAQARAMKLRDQLVGEQANDHFSEHAADFDRLCFAQVRLRDQAQAKRCADQVRQGDTGFFDMARESFLNNPAQCEKELFQSLWRFRLPIHLQLALTQAQPGEVLGPIADNDGYWIVQFLSVAPAKLDAETRRVVIARLFEQWLDERRREARIEWFLGKVHNVSPSE